MSVDLRPAPRPLAYTIEDAAVASGYSVSVLKRAIAKGDLVKRYANAKGVVLADDLAEWLQSLPVEPPKR